MTDETGLSILDLLRGDRAELVRKLADVDADISRAEGLPVASPDWLGFDKVVSDRASIGERFTTGLPTLDLRTDGGLYAGTVTIVQGKPGIGKTNLATQIALQLGKTCAVGALFADEGLPGAAVTIGQQLGFPRHELMRSNPEVCARAVASMAEQMPFFRFLKPSAKDAVVERLFEDLDRMAPAGMQRVALIDSAQVVRSRKKNGKQSRFDALAELLVTIHELAQEARSIALVISQVNRGSYRSKNEDERSDPMAAGYGTGGIEFMAHLLCHLDGSPTKERPEVTLKAVKNRLSAEGPFDVPLVMDMPRKRFMEIDAVHAQAAQAAELDAETAKRRKRIEGDIDKLVAGVPDGYLTGTIKTRVKGTDREKIDALNRMVEDGRLVMDELPRGGQRWKRSLGR